MENPEDSVPGPDVLRRQFPLDVPLEELVQSGVLSLLLMLWGKRVATVTPQGWRPVAPYS